MVGMEKGLFQSGIPTCTEDMACCPVDGLNVPLLVGAFHGKRYLKNRARLYTTS